MISTTLSWVNDFCSIPILFSNCFSEHVILVGSGSAGSVIASGLKGKILVLEAGSKGESFLLNIPIIQPLLQKSPFDWGFQTEPEENACKALTDNKCHWPFGKILGGSHRLNNLIYHRGHHSDYDSFMTANEAEELFKINEENVPISSGCFRSVVGKAFVEAGNYLGFDSFHFTNVTSRKGSRYTQIDHWRTLTNSPEVCVLATVSKILFDAKNSKKAIGVEYHKNEEFHKVYGKNIILSAGVIGSPKILLLSGIGPKDHLDKIGIDVKENLSGVGENLQDHVTTGLDLIILNQTVGLSVENLISPLKIFDYFWRDGIEAPLSFGGADAMGFVSLNISSEMPDLSFILLPVGLVADQGIHLRKILNLRDDIWDRQFKPLIGQTTISILPILLHPKSKGRVQLKSKNFNDLPIITTNYLTHDDDIKKLISAIRIIEKLVESPSMQKLGAEINPKPFPGCEIFFFNSDDYWECYVRAITLTMFHPIGTCKVGDIKDDSTVVLRNFQVKNLENLFVVDGSVLEKATTSNPHGIIAMLAQKFVKNMS